MSTFDGRIKEYPALSIDYFHSSPNAEFYVLSHVHSDHTKGLDSRYFNEKIYCSEGTAQMLPLMETRASRKLMYGHLKDRLVPVPYNETISLQTKAGKHIKLTFYPANHCFGSSLILIEGDNDDKKVVYTGDIRAESRFINENLLGLEKMKIHTLYMDTTCCDERKRDFITKQQSITLMIDFIKNQVPEQCHVYLDCWTVGYEEMWIDVCHFFDTKVHVSQNRYNMFTAVDSNYEIVLTTDPSETRFHSCNWDEGCCKFEGNMISIHPKPIANRDITVFYPSRQNRLLQTDLPKDCFPVQQYILPFSTHSSLSEIVAFHKLIHPTEFIPCVARGGQGGLLEIKNLLRAEGCVLNDEPSSADLARENETIPAILTRQAIDQNTGSSGGITYRPSVEGSRTLSYHSYMAKSYEERRAAANKKNRRTSSLPINNSFDRRPSIQTFRRQSHPKSPTEQRSSLHPLTVATVNRAQKSPTIASTNNDIRSTQKLCSSISDRIPAENVSSSNRDIVPTQNVAISNTTLTPKDVNKQFRSSSLTSTSATKETNTSNRAASLPLKHDGCNQMPIIFSRKQPKQTINESPTNGIMLCRDTLSVSGYDEVDIIFTPEEEEYNENSQQSSSSLCVEVTPEKFVITPQKNRQFLRMIKKVQVRRRRQCGTRDKPIVL